MAREVLGVVGAVVGGYFGYPQLGFVIGSIIGGVIDPEHVPGPKLGDASVQTSRDGVPIPIVWGLDHVVGNIIQLNPLQTVTKKIKSGKGGGPTTTETRRFRSFAIGIARGPTGPIVGLIRVWENNKLVYDNRMVPTLPTADSIAFLEGVNLYLGTETQLPDPELETITGVSLTPAYRGLAYIVFVDKDITDFGSSIPQYRFEIYTGDSSLLPPQNAVLAWWELEDTGGFLVLFNDEVHNYKGSAINTIVKATGIIGEGIIMQSVGARYFEIQEGPIQGDPLDENEGMLKALAIRDRHWSCAVWERTYTPVVAGAYVICSWNGNLGNEQVGVRQWRIKHNAAGNGFEFRINVGPYPDSHADIGVDTGDIGLTFASDYFIVATHDPVADEMTITVNAGTRFTQAISGGSVLYYNSEGDVIPGQTEIYTGTDVGNNAVASRNECTIDMPCFFSKTLDAGTITKMYNNGNGVNYSDLPL